MPHNVPLSSDVFDVMHKMRAMRRLKPDPVPDELIFKILAAGQAAASGGNTQRWKFLVLEGCRDQKEGGARASTRSCSTKSSGLVTRREPRCRRE